MVPASCLLLLLNDVGIQFGSVFRDGVLVVIVDGDLNDLAALGFISGVVELGYKGVGQSLLGSDTFVGVELQQFLQHVQGIGRGTREHVGEGSWAGGREGLEHGGSKRRVDGSDVVGSGTASNLYNLVELVHGGSAGEHGLAAKEFAKDAANAPHVDALGVLLGAQQDLGGTVPAGGHVVGEDGVGHVHVLQRGYRPRESKVRNLK